MDVFYGLGSFGDPRRDVAGYFLHRAMVERPGCRLKTLGQTRAREIQFTRFLNNEHVTLKRMVEQATALTAALSQDREVLAIQDSSDLVLGGRAARSRGFGPVGKGGQLGGLCLHAMLAIDAGTGGVLGLAHLAIKNRKGGKKVTPRRTRPLHQKESKRWLEGAQTASQVLAKASAITVVADRESDIYLSYAHCPDNVHLLSRVARDRKILTPQGQSLSLYGFSDGLPACDSFIAQLPPVPERPARWARLELRFSPVTVRRPRYLKAEDGPATLTLRLVEVREVAPPAGIKPVHWRLLTTHEVTTVQQAHRMVAFYQRRWLIEEYFKTLKSGGLDIEDAHIGKPETMTKLAAAASVAAVTIMKLKQARDGLTQEGMETVFEATDEPLFEALTQDLEGNTQKQKNPHAKGSLAWAQWVIARLGGWDGYYGKPGPKTYTRGLNAFYNIKRGAQLASTLV
jgi:Transposase DDE domain